MSRYFGVRTADLRKRDIQNRSFLQAAARERRRLATLLHAIFDSQTMCRVLPASTAEAHCNGEQALNSFANTPKPTLGDRKN